ncbi:MAG: CHAD domain-containing protein [Candidatus Omnitrophica bacterium]|nr:CHAD domain-containing protein [Candidatus Omnitrophota bacterium]
MVLNRIQAQIDENPHEPIALAGKKALSLNYDIFLDREEGALSGRDIEDIHRMRVSTRRIRALLKNMKDIYGRQRVKSFRKEFGRTADLLGKLRDIDTFVLFLEEYCPQLSKSVQPAVLELIEERLLVREQERLHLNEEFSQDWYKSLKNNFEDFLHHHTDEDLQSPAASSSAPFLIEKCLNKILAQNHSALKADQEKLHKLRIQFKQLRYLCESLAFCYGDEINPVIQEFIAIQDSLGAMQDFHRDIHFLKTNRKDILAGVQKNKAKSSLNELIDHFEQSLEKERKKFHKKWKIFCKNERRKSLLTLIRNGVLSERETKAPNPP